MARSRTVHIKSLSASIETEGSPRMPNAEVIELRKPIFRSRIITDFWPVADEAVAKYDKFMGEYGTHTYSSEHQCWDYWYLPKTYCYLRTDASKVLGRELIDDFMKCLKRLASEELEGVRPTAPWMSLHLNGMRHEIHNDSRNGTYAYIFSLTRPDPSFTGGETCIAKEGVFDAIEPRKNNAFTGYFEVIPPRFNQLLLFDDRLPHMVPVVQGTLNPLQGRLCLTGHMK